MTVTDGAGNGLETYTHGANLSGLVGGGAGGIGGILASSHGNSSSFYHYDFNGNVVSVTSTTQSPLAEYTYSPFGEVLFKEGDFNSRFQFSTKEFDALTGLNYYGYRFYSAEKGKWINRDPIQEQGGINLYGFVENRSFDTVDAFGLYSCLDLFTDKLNNINDPYRSCVDEGFYRHCVSSCFAGKCSMWSGFINSFIWTQLAALFYGGDFPWQAGASEDDRAGNLSGWVNAVLKAWQGCGKSCAKSYDRKVEEDCCPNNILLPN